VQHEHKPVRLVGAGPGAADLLTLRALQAIQAADVLLYDALVSDEILALAPAACLRLQTGKRAGKASLRQETINRLMLRFARRGRAVVRLKGGDPSIFGRSGEEAAFLEDNGVEVEVVPGVTAASAAAAQFGFPLTHRGQARRLVLATGRLADGPGNVDWASLADQDSTLVLYMARDTAAAAAQHLMHHGRDPATPAVAVENASLSVARCLRTTLARLGEDVGQAGFDGPAVLIVGEATAAARAAPVTTEAGLSSEAAEPTARGLRRPRVR
jgi:uroporphyrin-III C-methyltransferase